jgi:hypothetical protein
MSDEENPKKINVRKEHYEDREELPDNAAGVYWTVSGQEGMKMTTSAKTIIFEGKYPGKKNYTTAFTQAVLEARSDFNKKIRKGYVRDKSVLKKPGETYTFEELTKVKERGEHPWRVFAMALHDYKKFNHKLTFPATIQDKRDGTLFLVVHHPLLPLTRFWSENGKEIQLKIDGYSRGRDAYEGQDHILIELYEVAKEYPGLHFVGELWKEGFGLQDVSGSARRKADSKRGERIKLNFNVFDCFYIEQPELGFMERQKILDEVFATDDAKKWKYVIRIPTQVVEDDKEVQKLYQSYLEKGLEGAVVRNTDALYEFGINREIRSYTTLKLKPREDDEWPVVGFTEGKAKEAGAVIWIMAENESGVKERTGKLLPLDGRMTYTVTPNQETAVRQYIFDKLTKDPALFVSKVKGQLATISYSILSNDFLPQQPKFLHFRDPKIDELVAS